MSKNIHVLHKTSSNIRKVMPTVLTIHFTAYAEKDLISAACCLTCLSVFICVQDLINQGRQKVIEATNALKSLPRESLEDIIGRVVSVQGR